MVVDSFRVSLMVVGTFGVLVGLIWLVLGLFCMVVGGGRWRWVYLGWWWVVVGTFWVVVGGGGNFFWW